MIILEKYIKSDYILSFDKIIDFELWDDIVVAISELTSETWVVHYFPIDNRRTYRYHSIKETTFVEYSNENIQIMKGGREYIIYNIDKNIYYYCMLADTVLFLSSSINKNNKGPGTLYFFIEDYNVDNEQFEAEIGNRNLSNLNILQSPSQVGNSHKESKYVIFGSITLTLYDEFKSMSIKLYEKRMYWADFPDQKLITGLLSMPRYNDNISELALLFQHSIYCYYIATNNAQIYPFEISFREIIKIDQGCFIFWKKGMKKITVRKSME